MNYSAIKIPAAWESTSLQNHPDWIYTLSDQEVDELHIAADSCSDIPCESIGVEQFSISELSKTIKSKLIKQLETGIGCFLMRGLDPKKYNQSQIEKILFGMGLHFGTPMSQSVKGEKLHAVYNQGHRRSDAKARGTNTSFEIGFHNDPCDVAALMCVRKAVQGGGFLPEA